MEPIGEFWLCEDCTIAECNGDFSGMDEETQKRVDQGFDSLDVTLSADSDSNTGEGIRDFSNRICDVCHSHLAGKRNRFAAWPLEPAEPEDFARGT